MRRDLALAAMTLVLVVTAAVPLHRVFTTTEWRPGVLAAALVAATVAAALRRLRVPGALALIVSLLALVAFAARMHAGEAGPWPTPGALRELWRVTAAGFVDVRLQPAPTPPLDGLRMLLTLGVWVITHVTHESLVRLRRPGVAIIASGLLWFTPLAVPRSGLAAWPNALPFFIAGGLALLIEPDPDGSGWTQEDPSPRLPPGGVVLACVAAVFGLFVPWLLPGYGQPPWVDVTADTEPRGYQPIVDVGDRLHLPAARDVLRVEANQRLYLRLAALDTFDGRTWRLGPPDVETFRPDPDQLFRAEGRLPPETPIRDGAVVDASIEVLDLENIYVPVPYQIETIQGPDGAGLFYSRQGGFVATGEVEDNDLSGQTRVGVKEGFAYDLQAVVPSPTADTLAALGDVSLPATDPKVALPPGYDDFGDLTTSISEQAGATSTIETVLAVQDYFIGANSEFTYSTEVPELRGDDALRQFLFNTRVGYCEYYSTSMAVMLRAAGIPARVAVGFLPGEVTAPASEPGGPTTFTVSTSDAHAWVEVFFDQYGWIRMDPTPRSDGLPPTAADLDPQPPLSAAGGTEQPTDTSTTGGNVRDPANDFPNQFEDRTFPGLQGQFEVAGASMPRWVAGLLAIMVLGLLASGVVYGRPWWHRVLARRPDPDPLADVLAAQRRVLATAAHLGAGRRRDETVTEVALRWAHDGLVEPEDAAAFARIGSMAAFAGAADHDDAVQMRSLETRIVAGLAGGVDRRERLIAPWRDVASRVAERVGRD